MSLAERGDVAPDVETPDPQTLDDPFDAECRRGRGEDLDALRQIVSEVLGTDYVHRNGVEFGFFGEE